MNQALVVAVGRTLPAIFASWRTDGVGDPGVYLLVGMVVVFGLRVMQQNLRSQEQSLLDKDQALSNLWHAVLIATGQGVWDANLQTEQVYFSSAWKAQLGYEDAQIGNTFAEWTMRIHPDDVGRTKAAWAECENGRDDYDCVYRLRCQDGSYHSAHPRPGRVLSRDAQGRIVRIVGTNTDVSEERRLRSTLSI